jgi:hypothetical protein
VNHVATRQASTARTTEAGDAADGYAPAPGGRPPAPGARGRRARRPSGHPDGAYTARGARVRASPLLRYLRLLEVEHTNVKLFWLIVLLALKKILNVVYCCNSLLLLMLLAQWRLEKSINEYVVLVWSSLLPVPTVKS